MIYIGDSDTDIPCMKLVNSYGGHSIGVYNVSTKDKTKVYKMMRDNRIKYFAEADYSEGSELDKLVKAIIDRTAYNEILETKYFQYKNECMEAKQKCDEDFRKKKELILALEDSGSFATTHAIIAELKKYKSWSEDEIKGLMETAVKNTQVFYILMDSDVKTFFKTLLTKKNPKDKNAKIVENKINGEE